VPPRSFILGGRSLGRAIGARRLGAYRLPWEPAEVRGRELERPGKTAAHTFKERVTVFCAKHPEDVSWKKARAAVS
jgi:hypothetical protein